jgi:hypothetical protein
VIELTSGEDVQPCSDYQESSSKDWVCIIGFLVWDGWGFDGFGVSEEVLGGFFGLGHGGGGVYAKRARMGEG